MFRFTIRDMLWLTVVVALGVGWWTHYRALTKYDGLYSDEAIKLLEIEHKADPFGSRHSDLILSSGFLSREKAFATLGIDEKRLRDFRSSEKYQSVCTLAWQISPSYDLTCKTTLRHPDNKGLTIDDPKRMVCLIRIRERDPDHSQAATDNARGN